MLHDYDLARYDFDSFPEVLRDLVLIITSIAGSDRERDLVGSFLVEPKDQAVIDAPYIILPVLNDNGTVEIRTLGEVFRWTAVSY